MMLISLLTSSGSFFYSHLSLAPLAFFHAPLIFLMYSSFHFVIVSSSSHCPLIVLLFLILFFPHFSCFYSSCSSLCPTYFGYASSLLPLAPSFFTHSFPTCSASSSFLCPTHFSYISLHSLHATVFWSSHPLLDPFLAHISFFVTHHPPSLVFQSCTRPPSPSYFTSLFFSLLSFFFSCCSSFFCILCLPCHCLHLFLLLFSQKALSCKLSLNHGFSVTHKT